MTAGAQGLWLHFLAWSKAMAHAELSPSEEEALWRFVAQHAQQRLDDAEAERKYQRSRARAQ